jgi:2-keto-4-pentenoate hydratase
MNVLIWLANQQSRLGRGLDAGAIVTTGTCTGLDPVRVGDRAIADFGQLGSVQIMFTALTGRVS